MAITDTTWAMPARRSLTSRIKAKLAKRRRGRPTPLPFEKELRMNDHMLRDIGLTTGDVKRSLIVKRYWF